MLIVMIYFALVEDILEVMFVNTLLYLCSFFTGLQLYMTLNSINIVYFTCYLCYL